MIEIIVGIAAGSCGLTWMAAMYFFYRKVRPQFDSKSFQNLNLNLRRVGLCWSNKDSDFIPYQTGFLEKDRTQTFKSFFLITTLCSLVSVVGFVLLFLVLLTGKSRKEKLVFASPLVQSCDLPPEKILALVEEIKSNH